jgi:5'-nucleotidase (lipoprotein e(P4) family)
VAAHQVEIYYISNRSVEQLPATIKNLKKFGFPFADESHVLLKNSTSDKEPRRQKVKENHQIIMLLGDNLADFSSLFYRQNTTRRNALVDSLKILFGKRFVVFPNPMYGDWETRGILEGRYDWSAAQLDSIRTNKIRDY